MLIRNLILRCPVAVALVWKSSSIQAFRQQGSHCARNYHWIRQYQSTSATSRKYTHTPSLSSYLLNTRFPQSQTKPKQYTMALSYSSKSVDDAADDAAADAVDEVNVEKADAPLRRSARTRPSSSSSVKGEKTKAEKGIKSGKKVSKKQKTSSKISVQDENAECDEQQTLDDNDDDDEKETVKRVPKRPMKDSEKEDAPVAKKAKKTVKKKTAKKKKKEDDDDDNSTATTRKGKKDPVTAVAAKEKPKAKRSAKAADHQRLTERDNLTRLWNPDDHKDSYNFKICSWNVAGLRALLRTPERLPELVNKHNIDVLCLQETKLQESHVDDPKLKIREVLVKEGYESYYSCSTAKKGYSGTAVYVKRRGVKGQKKQPTLDAFFTKNNNNNNNKKDTTEDEDAPPTEEVPVDVKHLIPVGVSYKMGFESHDNEGRLITVDFPQFSLTNLYVPNSGQKLERLDYRTEKWDKDLLAFMQQHEKTRGVPVMWLGDLNVAHTNLEVWNDGAKHLAKQAGVTQQERDSFQAQLDSGYVDAFRKLHPQAKGWYSYWSQRAGNREPNKGLRLDYFICSPSLFDQSKDVVVRDSYMLHDIIGSDHCPVVLELEIKK